MLHLNVRKICITVLCLVICCSFPLSTAAAEDASWQDRAGDLWTQIKDKGSGFYESAKEKAPEVLEQAKDTAGKVADTVREQAPEVIDRAKEGVKDAQEAVSDWNASQQQQFWDRTEGLIYGESSVATETDSDGTTANDSAPTEEVNDGTATNGTTLAEAANRDSTSAEAASQAASTPPTSSPEVTVYDDYAMIDGERYEKPSTSGNLGVIICGIVTIVASSIALALTIVAVRSRLKNSR